MISEPECPTEFTVEFGRRLVSALGGDPSPIQAEWCWADFAAHFPALLERAEAYFERATVGDPAHAAYRMAHHCGSARKWAERVIERATVGDPAHAAYWMVRYCGSAREWADAVARQNR